LIVVAPHNEIWAGNGLGHIEVISTVNNSIVATIQTGGAYRADEGAYDDALGMCLHISNRNPANIARHRRTLPSRFVLTEAVGRQNNANRAIDEDIPYIAIISAANRK